MPMMVVTASSGIELDLSEILNGADKFMNNRRKAVILGMVAGALLGATLAWVASEDDDAYDDDEPRGIAKLGATDYFSLGMSILTLARQFGDMLR